MAAPGLSSNTRKELCVPVEYQPSSSPSPNCSQECAVCGSSKPCSDPSSCYHHHHHHHHHHHQSSASSSLGPRQLHHGSLKLPQNHDASSLAVGKHSSKSLEGQGIQHPVAHKKVPKGSSETSPMSPTIHEKPSQEESHLNLGCVSENLVREETAPTLKKLIAAGRNDAIIPTNLYAPSSNQHTINCAKKAGKILGSNITSTSTLVISNGASLKQVSAEMPQPMENIPSLCVCKAERLKEVLSVSDGQTDTGGSYVTASASTRDTGNIVEAEDIKEISPDAIAKVSDGVNNTEKVNENGKFSDSHVDLVESSKSSICRGSNSSGISDESSCSSFGSGINKPHKANDSRWEAIQAVRASEGVLSLICFRLLKRLGCGDIGSVYLAELCGTKTFFAVKVMDKAALASRKKLPRAQIEREILQSLDHPFLPTLYTHFETDTFSCLVMEFSPGGDLHTLRQRQPGKYFPEHAARFYVAEVLLAMEYLHMLGIIYRDLKPENVLVRDDGHIMLSDFDLSLRCAVSPTLVKFENSDGDPSKKNSAYCVQPACVEPSCVIQPSCVQPTCFAPRFLSGHSKKEKKPRPKNDVGNQVSPLPELIAEPTNARSMSFVGTHEYLAPEIIKGEGHGSAVDWWTFGIFLYELLFGRTPFKGSGNRATLFNVVGQPLRFPESPAVSFAARDLIRGLLVKEPQHRLAYRRGATEIKQHPFFQSVNWALIRCANPPDVPKPFEMDLLPIVEVSSASESAKNAAGLDVKPSGNYLDIDFF